MKLIKVCGMRNAENIRAVEQAGPDWMGFIFYEPSPRYVAEMPAYMPQQCKRVGVFVHPQFRDVVEKVKAFGLQAVQFHGTASPDMCDTFKQRGLTVIRALPVTNLLWPTRLNILARLTTSCLIPLRSSLAVADGATIGTCCNAILAPHPFC